ncbi:hypothetical protein C0V75_19790 [Tabrizicola sp. TH137]|nr:hypothetical protein C0V75_19790 [Tabrizicola sp. TH137]
MGGDHRLRRNGRQGVVLLAVLAGVVLIAALAGTLRARAGATQAALARLAEGHRVALAEVSVINRVRAEWAAPGVLRPVADGSPVVVTRDGMRWEVRVSDVEGLVDLYQAPGSVLALAGLPVGARNGMLAGLTPGDRYLSTVQTLAAMGVAADDRARLLPLVTQRARTGEINADLAPPELRAGAALLPETDIAGGDLAQISARRVD